MRFPLLALLAGGPAHGYELKQALEQRFGSVLPPINAGQIYTTLSRLERDGLVGDDAVAQNGRPNKRVYSLTEAGRAGAGRLGGRGHPPHGSRTTSSSSWCSPGPRGSRTRPS